MLTPRSHLAIKRGVYYYRRKLPSPHSGDVAVSLGTRGFREAQHLATSGARSIPARTGRQVTVARDSIACTAVVTSSSTIVTAAM